MFKTKIMLYSLALLLTQTQLQAADLNSIVTGVEGKETDEQILQHLVNNEFVEKQEDRIKQIRPEVTGKYVQNLLDESKYADLATLLNTLEGSDYKLPASCREVVDLSSREQKRKLRGKMRTLSETAARLTKNLSTLETILGVIETWDEESDEEFGYEYTDET